MKAFRMPSLGADMDEGTLVEWLKAPGSPVRRGDVVAVVETQKGAIEIEVFDDGILDAIRIAPGEKVPVGEVLATIRGPDEAPAADAPTPSPFETVPPPVAHEPLPTGPGALAAPGLPTGGAMAAPARREAAPPPSGGGPPGGTAPARPAPGPPLERAAGRRVTPAARRLAAERGISLDRLEAGADGVIGLREVAAAAGPGAPRRGRPPGPDRGEMRRAIAAAMARANRDIPHYSVTSTLDATPLMDWIAGRNAGRPVTERILYAAPLLKAVALALADTPDLVGHFVDGRFVAAATVNLGVAVALRGGGLMIPAIAAAETLTVDALMARLDDLVRRARTGGLRSSELASGTVTVTNLGEDTADTLVPIIYPPQVAIVGIGQIRARPAVHGGRVVPRQLLDVTLAGDHRVSDGRTGARFLGRLADRLARPEAL